MKRLILSILFFFAAVTAFAQGAFDYVATASGTDTYAATILVPTFPSSYTGVEMRITFTNANTGASTINITRSTGAVGAAAIRKWDGDSFEPLVAGDIPAGEQITLRYTGSYFIMDSFGKGSSGGTVATSRTINTTAPLTGGGDLSANRTISIPAADGSTDGYMPSADFARFDNSVLTQVSTSTAGSTITLDMDFKTQRMFYGSAAFSSGKNIVLADTANALVFYFTFIVNSSGGTLTMPTNWKIEDDRVTGHVFTPAGADTLELWGARNAFNNSWNVAISGTATGATWGGIDGTLSDQIDLQNTFNTKVDKVLAADLNISGAFSLGLGVTPTAKYHIKGLGTTTGDLFKLDDNSNTNRALIDDNGQATFTALPPSGTQTGYSFAPTLTGTASTGEVLTGLDVNLTPSGTTTSDDIFIARFRISGNVAYRFLDGIQQFGNSTGAPWLGTTSTTRVPGFAATTFNLRTHGTWSTTANGVGLLIDIRGSSSVQSGTGILVDSPDANHWAVSSGSNTWSMMSLRPKFNVTGGTNTGIILDLQPTENSIAGFSNYLAVRSTSANAFWAIGQSTATALMDLAGSTTARASMRIRSGTPPTSPNDGEFWNDGTSISYRVGSSNYGLPRVLVGTGTLDFDLSSIDSHDLTITVTGAADGDVIALGIPSAAFVSGVAYTYAVTAANTVTVRCHCVTPACAANPGSGTFTARVSK